MRWLSLFTGLLALGVAPAAWASPFTLTSQIVVDGTNNAGTGIFATIDPVNSLAGGGPLVTSGTVNAGFAGQDVFTFDITLSGLSADVNYIEVAVITSGFFGLDLQGAGYFSGDAGQAPTTVIFDFIEFEGDFDFSPPATGTLNAGETTVRLFVTYGPGSTMQIGDLVNIFFSPGSGAGDFMVQGTIIPEPSTLLLVGGGLAALGIRASRRRQAL